MAQRTWREDPEENRELQDKLKIGKSDWALKQATPHTAGLAEGVAGAVAVPALAARFGTGKVIEAGLQAAFPDAADTVLERALDFNKPIKYAAKAYRLKDKLSEWLNPKIWRNTGNAYEYNFELIDDVVANPDAIYPPGSEAAKIQETIQPSSPAPRPEWGWRKTPDAAERNVLLDRFAQEVQVSSKGVDIAKRREAGYKFLGPFASEWNSWSKSNQFIDELSDNLGSAYVEHLVGKGNRLDFFWRIPDNIRFRKGSRHSPNNVRLLYSDRFKKFKDATENILYKQQANTPDMNRLVVDLDIPRMKGKSITVKQAPKDLVLKRVDGTVVGRLGDYHDVLYAPADVLEKALTTNINPKTNKFYIDPNTGNMKKAIRHWREKILLEKINFIIKEAPTLEGYKTKKAKFQYQESAIQQDLVDFLEEYKFIPKPKGSTLKQQLLSEPAFGLRGGTSIKQTQPSWKNKLKRGPFQGLTKTGEREVEAVKRKKGITRSLKDVLDEIDFHD